MRKGKYNRNETLVPLLFEQRAVVTGRYLLAVLSVWMMGSQEHRHQPQSGLFRFLISVLWLALVWFLCEKVAAALSHLHFIIPISMGWVCLVKATQTAKCICCHKTPILSVSDHYSAITKETSHPPDIWNFYSYHITPVSCRTQLTQLLNKHHWDFETHDTAIIQSSTVLFEPKVVFFFFKLANGRN